MRTSLSTLKLFKLKLSQLNLVSILSALLFANGLNAEVIQASSQGFSITNVSVSKAPAAHVYANLVNKVDNWWPKDHSWWRGQLSIDNKAGGCFCEIQGTNSAIHMQVSFVAPNKKIIMLGGLGPLQEMGMTGALTWQFEAIEEGSRVTLTYHVNGTIDANPLSLAEAVDNVQQSQLGSLITFSDGNYVNTD